MPQPRVSTWGGLPHVTCCDFATFRGISRLHPCRPLGRALLTVSLASFIFSLFPPPLSVLAYAPLEGSVLVEGTHFLLLPGHSPRNTLCYPDTNLRSQIRGNKFSLQFTTSEATTYKLHKSNSPVQKNKYNVLAKGKYIYTVLVIN